MTHLCRPLVGRYLMMRPGNQLLALGQYTLTRHLTRTKPNRTDTPGKCDESRYSYTTTGQRSCECWSRLWTRV